MFFNLCKYRNLSIKLHRKEDVDPHEKCMANNMYLEQVLSVLLWQ